MFSILQRVVKVFKAKISKYVSQLVLHCFAFQRSSYSSSLVKEAALDIIELLTQNQMLSVADAKMVISELMDTLAISHATGQIRTGKLKLKILGKASRHYPAEMSGYSVSLRRELLRTVQIRTSESSFVSSPTTKPPPQSSNFIYHSTLVDQHRIGRRGSNSALRSHVQLPL